MYGLFSPYALSRGHRGFDLKGIRMTSESISSRGCMKAHLQPSDLALFDLKFHDTRFLLLPTFKSQIFKLFIAFSGAGYWNGRFMYILENKPL